MDPVDWECTGCGFVLRVPAAASWPITCFKCGGTSWVNHVPTAGAAPPPRLVPPHVPGWDGKIHNGLDEVAL